MAAWREEPRKRSTSEPVNLAGVSREMLRNLIVRERIYGRAFSQLAEAARTELAKQTSRP